MKLPVLVIGVLGFAVASAAGAQQSGQTTAATTGGASQWTYDEANGVRCRDVEVVRPAEVRDQNRIGGTAAGAVVGGLIGNQVGGGSGRRLATAAGAVGGGLAGREIQGRNQASATEVVVERQCESIR